MERVNNKIRTLPRLDRIWIIVEQGWESLPGEDDGIRRRCERSRLS